MNKEIKNTSTGSASSICQNCKQSFVIEQEDFDFYKKIDVPPPTFCPTCRFQRRLAWRNERIFHKRKCNVPSHDHSVVSFISDAYPGLVYDKDYWWSDEWDPSVFAREYDFSRPFFEQIGEFIKKVPCPSIWSLNTINSEYTGYSANSKNVYLCASALDSEDVCYGYNIDKVKEAVDVLQVSNSELVYDLVGCSSMQRSTACIDSKQCINCHFLYGSVNCQDCFMAGNLRNARYVFRGEQLTKEEYEKKITSVNLGSLVVRKALWKEFGGVCNSVIRKYAQIEGSPGCTGNDIKSASNVIASFYVSNSQNIKYSSRVVSGSRDSYDITSATGELSYEVVTGGFNNNNSHFYTNCNVSRNVEYSAFCLNCTDIFACHSLRNKKYCIFNKQYEKEEYYALREKIIRHMDEMPYKDGRGNIYKYGEFFPLEFSPFGYNDTPAMQEFPMSEEEIRRSGYNYIPEDSRQYKPTVSNIPDTITETPDDFYKEIISCSHAGKCECQCTEMFRLHPTELGIYKKMNIPVPDLCVNCRYLEHRLRRPPLKLWHRSCMCEKAGHDHESKCKNEFETPYSPERPEKVYCESCYQKEVV